MSILDLDSTLEPLGIKKTIVYVGGFGLPDRTASAQRAIANAKLFKMIGFNVVLMGKIEKGNEENITHCVVEGIDCFDIRHPDKAQHYPSYISSIDSIKHVISLIGLENVYAVIAYQYPPAALNKLIKFSRNEGIKMIAECTEWHGIEGRKIIRNVLRFFQTEYRMRYLARKAGNIICASRHSQRYYSDCQTVVLPFVIDTNLSKWHVPTGPANNMPRRFIYAGSPGVGLCKDYIHYLIDAFVQVKKSGADFNFTIVGLSEEQFLLHLPAYKEKIAFLEGKVDFLGRLSHEKTVAQVRQSDFFIFIRPQNRVSQFGFPTKLAEAFSCGIPTITNDTSDIGLYIQNKKNGYLLKHPDKVELQAAIIEALTISDDELQRMKSDCLENNPFRFENFREQVKDFLLNAR